MEEKLNEKDLEKLGWIFDNKKINYRHPNTNIKMQVSSIGNRIRFYIPGRQNGTFSNELTLEVKTKNELKKLMEQLKII